MTSSNIHKIFGSKESTTYLDREGAYIIPIKDNKIGIIKTPKGYFLLGGGKEENENDNQAIERECLEETGYTVFIKEKICSAEAYVIHPQIGYFHPVQAYYVGELLEKVKEPMEIDHQFLWIELEKVKGKMFSQMQNWAIEIAMKFLD